MKVYKTYQDCKIANQSSEVIQRNGDAMFLPVGNSELIPMLSGCINCKPSEYLISIKDFFDRGHVFLVGDCFLNQHGEVIEVGKRYEDGIVIMPDEANRRIPGTDEHCYILRASAMEIPTQSPEEREALDMIDTTSKQVESLVKGGLAEWKNGDNLEYIDGDGEWSEFLGRYISFDEYAGFHVIYASDGNIYHAESEQIRKPESQEQKAERDNLSIARELAFVYCKSTGDKPSDDIVERMSSFVSMIKNIKDSK